MKYIIHRGITSKTNKENSYMAIKKALLDPTSLGIEIDIRLTKDNIIVLSHNSIINTNYIENMTYKEIIKYKHLTTLDKILDINTNKIILIDIKVNNNYKIFGNTLLNMINDSNRNIYLMSFNKKIIKYLYNKTSYPIGIISFFYRKNKYPIVVLNNKTIKDKILKKINNKEIFLWTFNNTKEIQSISKNITNIDNYYLIIDKEE